MNFGVQIFGCMKEFRENPKDFLNKISHMGYTQIEPCVILGDISAVPDELQNLLWKPEEAVIFQGLMEDFGLKLKSCHIFAKDIAGCADDAIALCESTSIDALVVNCPEDIENTFADFADQCLYLSDRLSEHEIPLWIHNSAPEIQHKIVVDDMKLTILEAILKACGGKVKAQIDVGWVLYAGMNPSEYIKALGDMVASVHFKDMNKNFQNLRGNDIFAVLGDGAIDIKSVFSALPDSPDTTVIVDQDVSFGNFYDDLKKSFDKLSASL